MSFKMDANSCYGHCHRYPHHLHHQPVAGVIGASFSGVSIMVANILKLFRVSPF